jgi:hypothetical protein
MKRRWNRTLAAVAAAAGIVLAGTVPAAAYSSEAVPQETGETAGPAGEEKMETGGPLEENRPGPAETTPFSKPGNGSLVDDAGGDGTKQFLSVQTKNGNMFYIVVDRSGSTENVYMMSLVDENDLKEFLEEDSLEDAEMAEAAPLVPDLEPPSDQETGDGGITEQEEGMDEKKHSGMGAAIPVLAVFGGCAAGIYYLKVLRPRKETGTDGEEEMGFFDAYGESSEDAAETEK